MGFDLCFLVNLHLCNETGKPFYYGTNPETNRMDKLYGIPEVEIPKELRKSLVLRGHFLHVYTDFFNENDLYDVSVSAFQEHFPTWDEFAESEYYTDDDPDAWTEKDHKNLKKLVSFLCKQPIPYTVSWSY
jgi:hypothetical protein